MMKLLLLTVLAAEPATGAEGATDSMTENQETPKVEKVGDREWGSGFSATALLRGTSASANFGMMIGGRLAWRADERFSLGLAGFHTWVGPELETNGLFRNERRIRMGYGGPHIAYSFASNEMIHLDVHGMFGFGGVGHVGAVDETFIGSDLMFVVEPGADIVINVTDMIKVNLGVSYRFAYDVNVYGISNGANTNLENNQAIGNPNAANVIPVNTNQVNGVNLDAGVSIVL